MASKAPSPPPDCIELRPKLVIHRDENPELWERLSKVSSKRQGAFIMLLLNQSLANEKIAAMAKTLMAGGVPIPRESLAVATVGDSAMPALPVATNGAAQSQPQAATKGDEVDALSQAFGGGGLENFLSLGR